MAKKTGPKPPTKTEILNSMAEATGTSKKEVQVFFDALTACLLYTSPSPRDLSTSRMPSSA